MEVCQFAMSCNKRAESGLAWSGLADDDDHHCLALFSVSVSIVVYNV